MPGLTGGMDGALYYVLCMYVYIAESSQTDVHYNLMNGNSGNSFTFVFISCCCTTTTTASLYVLLLLLPVDGVL